MANRRVAMEMMLEIAMHDQYKQFIFLTPHDIRYDYFCISSLCARRMCQGIASYCSIYLFGTLG